MKPDIFVTTLKKFLSELQLCDVKAGSAPACGANLSKSTKLGPTKCVPSYIICKLMEILSKVNYIQF